MIFVGFAFTSWHRKCSGHSPSPWILSYDPDWQGWATHSINHPCLTEKGACVICGGPTDTIWFHVVWKLTFCMIPYILEIAGIVTYSSNPRILGTKAGGSQKSEASLGCIIIVRSCFKLNPLFKKKKTRGWRDGSIQSITFKVLQSKKTWKACIRKIWYIDKKFPGPARRLSS